MIILIIAEFFLYYLMLAGVLEVAFAEAIQPLITDMSNSMRFVIEYYAPTIMDMLVFLLVCLIFRKNRFMLDVIKPARDGRSMKMLMIGLLLGFGANFFCILVAILHGDVKFYYSFHAADIPMMIFAFICVLIQSSSEELWCRTFLYERIDIRYPLWVAVLINSLLFGMLHMFNPGVNPLAMADLVICGIAYSLLRWYSGSIWTCFGIHAMWNFTQNFIFGLPNSGLVSEASVLHLDAVNGISNIFYSYEFGVEGALPAVFMDSLLAVMLLWLGYRDGRLSELLESREARCVGEIKNDHK